mmetsp:Transcript_51939/g.130508  ORF Transcript_51939/g.130508 Transcript_51939/m.130508 type:complete len:97 (+) Transcript_51939:1769-2059(+)
MFCCCMYLCIYRIHTWIGASRCVMDAFALSVQQRHADPWISELHSFIESVSLCVYMCLTTHLTYNIGMMPCPALHRKTDLAVTKFTLPSPDRRRGK